MTRFISIYISMLNKIPLASLIISSLIFSQGCAVFAVGLFPFAEKYVVNYEVNEVIEAVKRFKREYPEYRVSATTSIRLVDKYNKEFGYHKFYFYYPDKNMILYTFLMYPSDFEGSELHFGFSSINEGQQIPNWKDLNDIRYGYGYFESRKLKAEFEERIWDVIQGYLAEEN